MNDLTQDQIVQIAKDAYTYGFPLVMMDITKQVQTNLDYPSGGHAPANQVGRAQTFPTYETTEVVKPNVDTLYNIVWFDLDTKDDNGDVEAFVLNVPNTGTFPYSKEDTEGRYYLLPFLDAYSNVHVSKGTRHTGKEAHLYLVTGPNWSGVVPDNMQEIKMPTPMAWMLGRIQANSDDDGQQIVWPLQQQLKVTPLSEWNNPAYTPAEGSYDELLEGIKPVEFVFTLSYEEFIFDMLNLMVANPPPKDQDNDIIERMKSIGIEAGVQFNLDTFTEETKMRINAIPKTIALEWQKDILPILEAEGEIQNNWVNITKNIGRYGVHYLKRAFIAYKGLGANIVEDAIYPVCEKDDGSSHLVGGKNYIITIPSDQLTPAKAFWSITAYNQSDFLVDNPNNVNEIYALRGTDLNIENGQAVILVQPTAPSDSNANWLPSPLSGLMSLTMRLYWPKEEVLDGTWKPPVVSVNTNPN